MSWTNKQTSFLICLYRNAPELYNPENPFHLKMDRKQTALERIAQHINVVRPNTTVMEVIEKITSLRVQFNQQFKSYQNTHGKGGKTITLWCFGSLLFLGDYVNVCPSLFKTSQSSCDGRCQDEDYLRHNDNNSVAEGTENNAALESINRKLDQMMQSTDQWDTFGKFIAAEIRELKSERSRNKTKLIRDVLQAAQDEDRV